MTCLKNHISESNQMSQPEFLYEVFEDFMDSPESKDFSLAITKRSKIHCPICPKENSIQIVIYRRPYLAMTSFPSDCQAKYCLTNSKHEIEIRIHAQIPIKIEASAAFRTLSGRFSPSALEMAAFSPIAFPKPSAEIII